METEEKESIEEQEDLVIPMEELNPREAFMYINGICRFFNPFDLVAKVWAKFEFATDDERDGTVNLQALFLAMDIETCTKVLYYLLKDKDKRDFPTEASFYTAVNKRNHAKLFKVLSEVFGLSEAHIKKAEEQAIAKKVMAAKSGNRIT